VKNMGILGVGGGVPVGAPFATLGTEALVRL